MVRKKKPRAHNKISEIRIKGSGSNQAILPSKKIDINEYRTKPVETIAVAGAKTNMKKLSSLILSPYPANIQVT